MRRASRSVHPHHTPHPTRSFHGLDLQERELLGAEPVLTSSRVPSTHPQGSCSAITVDCCHMTVQKEVRAPPVLLGARLPLSDLWFWEHQLQPSLEVESELRCGQSEPRIPLTLSDWLGVAHFSTNESPGKACLKGAKIGGRQVVRL